MLVPRSCQLNILQRQDLIDYVSSRFGVSCSPVSLGRCGTSGGTSAEEFVTQTSGNKKSNGATFALPFILSSSQRKEQHKYQQQQQKKHYKKQMESSCRRHSRCGSRIMCSSPGTVRRYVRHVSYV